MEPAFADFEEPAFADFEEPAFADFEESTIADFEELASADFEEPAFDFEESTIADFEELASADFEEHAFADFEGLAFANFEQLASADFASACFEEPGNYLSTPSRSFEPTMNKDCYTVAALSQVCMQDLSVAMIGYDQNVQHPVYPQITAQNSEHMLLNHCSSQKFSPFITSNSNYLSPSLTEATPFCSSPRCAYPCISSSTNERAKTKPEFRVQPGGLWSGAILNSMAQPAASVHASSNSNPTDDEAHRLKRQST